MDRSTVAVQRPDEEKRDAAGGIGDKHGEDEAPPGGFDPRQRLRLPFSAPVADRPRLRHHHVAAVVHRAVDWLLFTCCRKILRCNRNGRNQSDRVS
jgi:hypothetical protein